MPKIPAAFTLFIAATLTGRASTVKKPDDNKTKQTCISEVATKQPPAERRVGLKAWRLKLRVHGE